MQGEKNSSGAGPIASTDFYLILVRNVGWDTLSHLGHLWGPVQMKTQSSLVKKQEKRFLLSSVVLRSTCCSGAFYLLFTAIVLQVWDSHRMDTSPHQHRRPHSVMKAFRAHVQPRPPPVWKVTTVLDWAGSGANASEAQEAV